MNDRAQVTTLSRQGNPSVEDVFKGDLWFFPAGLPHSLQGLGPDGAEFVLAFDSGNQSETNTLLLTDWLAHTPPDVLAKNFRVAQETFDDMPLHGLWIFPGDEPGDLEADQVAAGVEWGTPEPVIFRMSESSRCTRTAAAASHRGQHELRGIKTVAAAWSGQRAAAGLRPNADEWSYWGGEWGDREPVPPDDRAGDGLGTRCLWSSFNISPFASSAGAGARAPMPIRDSDEIAVNMYSRRAARELPGPDREWAIMTEGSAGSDQP